MKIRIDIDCTPKEARSFLGLPDVEPLQKQMMEQLGEKIQSYAANMDMEALMKMWMTGGLKGMENLQQQFWAQFAPGSGKKDR